ncbi:hypothetical protein [Roseobacter sinensis]|uniref:Squalene cyclase C-terminal domain-containing protein n=1 Tax=Roseobacter sinensis TaxID=2931391 RepID=A0ABT3BER7_9RHOB|nr:hypothetical protein [Roseobacter sp. WL0113]MCV3272073.1 hypothetical protein [Roseobacter sp. WL0113]
MTDPDPIPWLLAGDPAIQYQTHRDLLGVDRPDIRARIATEGWGAAFLAARHADGSWGEGFYRPKWTCTHYTLLDLRLLGLAPDHPQARDSIRRLLADGKGPDGGLLCAPEDRASDVCVNGMVLNYASYFRTPETLLRSVVDALLAQHMPDGGFNCRSNRSGARHSSLHSTLSVLEGIQSYQAGGYGYRQKALQETAAQARDFVLQHRFYKSDRTGRIIRDDFLRLSVPPRWCYNILRGLDHFREAGAPYDARMGDALEVLVSKRRRDGRWPVQAARPGQTHVRMEHPRKASRWVTLMALRVLGTYPMH